MIKVRAIPCHFCCCGTFRKAFGDYADRKRLRHVSQGGCGQPHGPALPDPHGDTKHKEVIVGVAVPLTSANVLICTAHHNDAETVHAMNSHSHPF